MQIRDEDRHRLRDEERPREEDKNRRPRAAPTPVLLATQGLFNVGFFAVVPFLAIVLADDFALAGSAVGIVLGIRTFAQQGMFVIGGSLVDRFGAKAVILAGIATRVAGFLALAASLRAPAPILSLFVVGTVLTGLGGALFSPGLSALVARADASRPGRTTLFAWLNVTGEIGAVLGPLAGAALLGLGFAVVAGAGAVYFAAIGVLLAAVAPRSARIRRDDGRATTVHASLRAVLSDRRFRRFAALHSVELLAYNQLYLAVPLALATTDAPAQTVAGVFAWVSLLTLVAQLPIARAAARLGAPRALRLAYLTSATGFALVAAAFALPGPGRVCAAVLGATCFALGHLVGNPTAMGLVGALAGTRALGSFFGLLATGGGVAVLVGNVAVGLLQEALPPEGTTGAWLVLAAAPATSAILIRRVLGAPARPVPQAIEAR